MISFTVLQEENKWWINVNTIILSMWWKQFVKWKTIGKILTKTKKKRIAKYSGIMYAVCMCIYYIFQKGSQVLKDMAKRKIEISNAEEKNQAYTITWNTRISRIMWLVSYQLYRSHKQQQLLLQNTQIYCYSIALCMIGQILSTAWLKIVNNSKIITKNKRKYFVCIFFSCVFHSQWGERRHHCLVKHNKYSEKNEIRKSKRKKKLEKLSKSKSISSKWW